MNLGPLNAVTKEIALFSAVAVLVGLAALDALQKPQQGGLLDEPNQLASKLDEQAATGALNKVSDNEQKRAFGKFLDNNFGAGGAPGRGGVSGEAFDKPNLNVYAPVDRHARQLFFKSSDLRPTGRVSLPPPKTPGISIARTFIEGGPDFQFVRTRDPLPVLTPDQLYDGSQGNPPSDPPQDPPTDPDGSDPNESDGF